MDDGVVARCFMCLTWHYKDEMKLVQLPTGPVRDTCSACYEALKKAIDERKGED